MIWRRGRVSIRLSRGGRFVHPPAEDAARWLPCFYPLESRGSFRTNLTAIGCELDEVSIRLSRGGRFVRGWKRHFSACVSIRLSRGGRFVLPEQVPLLGAKRVSIRLSRGGRFVPDFIERGEER